MPTTNKIVVHATVQKAKQEESAITMVSKRHSCWFKLRWRTAVWVMFWKTKCNGIQGVQLHYPKTQDLRDAELRWIRFVQKEAFQKEIEALRRKTKFPNISKLKDLNAFLQDE
ncbi:unnamed protein product, partial [Allacma fusca]